MSFFKYVAKFICVNTFSFFSTLCKKVTSIMYHCLFLSEWGIIDAPDNYDHELDLFWKWPKYCYPHWIERGVYNLQAIKMFEKPILLSLCCGDGFNEKHFYSTSVEKIYAVDFDKSIIRLAKRKNHMPNIKYQVLDIRNDFSDIFPSSNQITNIIWDAGIEYFKAEEIDSIMKSIKKTLDRTHGIVSGFTHVDKPSQNHSDNRTYKFKSMEDLKQFFEPYFKNILVFETIYNDRHNLYFYASDGNIPFSSDWCHMLKNEE